LFLILDFNPRIYTTGAIKNNNNNTILYIECHSAVPSEAQKTLQNAKNGVQRTIGYKSS